jgi:peptidyl-prolyl cis-trans isomerase B (cyclophilin B)
VSPKQREREYAKRRYQKWQDRRLERYLRQRRLRRNGYAAAAAVLVLAGGFGAYHFWGPKPKVKPVATSSPCSPAPTAAAAAKSWPKPPATSLAEKKTWKATVETNCGPLLIELDGAKAPQGVASTIFLIQQGFYNNVSCHRLTTANIYVLQCGDPTGSGSGGPGYTYGPIENAPKDGVYPAGTVAMARPGNSANGMGSQFFLVYKDSPIPADNVGGYTVLGKITGGMATVEKVAAGGVAGGGTDGAPTRAVSMLSASVAPNQP